MRFIAPINIKNIHTNSIWEMAGDIWVMYFLKLKMTCNGLSSDSNFYIKGWNLIVLFHFETRQVFLPHPVVTKASLSASNDLCKEFHQQLNYHILAFFFFFLFLFLLLLLLLLLILLLQIRVAQLQPFRLWTSQISITCRTLTQNLSQKPCGTYLEWCCSHWLWLNLLSGLE
jgi:hypothetical protein